MKYVRLFSGPDDRSYLEEQELSLNQVSHFELMSKELKFQQAQFNETVPGHQYEWHNAPRKQYVITLQGQIEIETGTGPNQIVGVGELLLAEDLSGRGHRTKVISSIPWRCIYLPIA